MRASLPATNAHDRRSVEKLANQVVLRDRVMQPPEALGRAKMAVRHGIQGMEDDEG